MNLHQEILTQIGNSLDIELKFDEHGQCFLLLDEHLMVSVRGLNDAWILYGMLGNLEENEASQRTVRTLLSLNLRLAESGSGTIAIEKSSNVMMLLLRVDIHDMDGERMKDVLGHFVDTLSNTLTALGSDLAPAVPTSLASVFPMGSGMFERA